MATSGDPCWPDHFAMNFIVPDLGTLPGETEAGSAGKQPCRGIARRAHRDDVFLWETVCTRAAPDFGTTRTEDPITCFDAKLPPLFESRT